MLDFNSVQGKIVDIVSGSYRKMCWNRGVNGGHQGLNTTTSNIFYKCGA